MEANTNPDLGEGFCTTGTKIDIPEQLQLLGVTPENPTIHGHVINKLFNMIFENLNHQKKKGISFWESDEEYEATANNIDICRRNNKIYFCKQTHNDTGDAPKDPATNPDYWGLLLDLDNPIHEALTNYALANHNHDTTYAKLGGVNTQEFLVKAGTNAKSAVNKEQMETAINNASQTVLQVAYSELTTSGTGTSTMPQNSDTPTNINGNEILTVSITPKRADSKLLVIANTYVGEASNTADNVMGAVFRDGETNAIIAKAGTGHSAGTYSALSMLPIDMQRRVPSNSINETTFKLRVGVNNGACRWNGVSSAHFGGSAGITSMLVMEVL